MKKANNLTISWKTSYKDTKNKIKSKENKLANYKLKLKFYRTNNKIPKLFKMMLNPNYKVEYKNLKYNWKTRNKYRKNYNNLKKK